MNAAANAADRLLVEKESLARAITATLYEEMPELDGKYGEVGRRRCLEDMRYNLEHLAPSVDLGDPEMFAKYVIWLDDLLRARNVATDEVAHTLVLTEKLVRERFPAEEAAAVARSIEAGLAVLNAAEDR